MTSNCNNECVKPRHLVALSAFRIAAALPVRATEYWVATDLAGNKRKTGRVDIGCYEQTSAATLILMQ